MDAADDAHSAQYRTHSNGFSNFDHPLRAKAFSTGKNVEGGDGFRDYIHINAHPNGGATVVHMYHSEFEHLSTVQMDELTQMFFQEVFQEEPLGVAKHVMGIVHGAASYLPELVRHLGLCHPDLPVKVGHLKKSEVETMRMEEYMEKVKDSYSSGTFQYGPLLQMSLVGQVSEESGGYFPQILG